MAKKNIWIFYFYVFCFSNNKSKLRLRLTPALPARLIFFVLWMKIKLRCVQSPICKNLKTPELNSSIPQLQRVLNVDAKKVKYKVLLLLPCERVLWCNLATHTEITIYLYIQSIVNHELSENCIMFNYGIICTRIKCIFTHPKVSGSQTSQKENL